MKSFGGFDYIIVGGSSNLRIVTGALIDGRRSFLVIPIARPWRAALETPVSESAV
jgi:hypothetical protein